MEGPYKINEHQSGFYVPAFRSGNNNKVTGFNALAIFIMGGLDAKPKAVLY
jgi:hypothetical protein